MHVYDSVCYLWRAIVTSRVLFKCLTVSYTSPVTDCLYNGSDYLCIQVHVYHYILGGGGIINRLGCTSQVLSCSLVSNNDR